MSPHRTRRLSSAFSLLAAAMGLFLTSLWAGPAAAQDAFQKMLDRVPRSANAVVLLNVEKAIASPMGVREGWKEDLDKAYADGLIRIPPQASRLVVAAQLDFEFFKPIWQSAVVDLSVDPSISAIAQRRGGAVEEIEGLQAVVLPNDAYLAQTGPRTLAAMAPANRQLVVRWIREAKGGLVLSPYLRKAAGYSDNVGSQLIMAVDLEGAFSSERIVQYLKSKPDMVAQSGVELSTLARQLATIQGIRLGVVLREQPTAAVAVDFGTAWPLKPDFTKSMVLEILANGGLMIDDVAGWKCTVRGAEVMLDGPLSVEGLRRVMSLIESPAPPSKLDADSTPAPAPAAGEVPESKIVAATLKTFQTIDKMLRDLKVELKDANNLASTTLWFDRYADKIDRLPILNVDEEMVNYAAFVAEQLRAASGAVRTMGIRGGVRQSEIISSGAGYGVAGYGYRANWWGEAAYAVPYYNPRAEFRGVMAERRVVRAEERGAAAGDVQAIRSQIIAATSDIRRKMTQKYKVEF